MRLVTAIGCGSHLAHAGAGLVEGLSETFDKDACGGEGSVMSALAGDSGGNPGQVGRNPALAAGGRVIAAGQGAGNHGRPGSRLLWREVHGVPAQEPSGKVDGM